MIVAEGLSSPNYPHDLHNLKSILSQYLLIRIATANNRLLLDTGYYPYDER